MKQLTQTQFFVAALVLVVALALVAVLSQGLKKYDGEVYQAEQEMVESAKAVTPSNPDEIIEELKKEEASASAAIEAELALETRAIEEENMDITSITQSYE